MIRPVTDCRIAGPPISAIASMAMPRTAKRSGKGARPWPVMTMLKALQKLKEKKELAWMLAEDKEEQAFLDEIAMRKKKGSE